MRLHPPPPPPPPPVFVSSRTHEANHQEVAKVIVMGGLGRSSTLGTPSASILLGLACPGLREHLPKFPSCPSGDKRALPVSKMNNSVEESGSQVIKIAFIFGPLKEALLNPRPKPFGFVGESTGIVLNFTLYFWVSSHVRSQ